MKRFHIHLSVADLPQATGFYSRLFGAEPTVLEDDYAKWMLEDPRINFAVSARGGEPGLNHLGFQVDESEELEALRARFEQADIASVAETGAACCYARSDKHWVQDPAGIAWEHFHSLGEIPMFGGGTASAKSDAAEQAEEAISSGCCAPQPPAASQAPTSASGCCGPRA